MIDHRYQIRSNWKFLKPTPRECKGYEAPHKGDWIVWVGCVCLLGLYLVVVELTR